MLISLHCQREQVFLAYNHDWIVFFSSSLKLRCEINKITLMGFFKFLKKRPQGIMNLMIFGIACYFDVFK